VIATGSVHDETGAALTLERVVDLALADEGMARRQVDGRPFLVELARRVLSLGHLGDGGRLLDPRLSEVDPDCGDGPLALARALTAVELLDAGLLTAVVARRCAWSERATDAAPPTSLSPWLAVLLQDVTAQCLLVGAFVAPPPGACEMDITRLLRRLIALHEDANLPEVPSGPLPACFTLGALLRRPREAQRVREFKDRVQGWRGWQDLDQWPTRPPGGGLGGLMERLTERVAEAVGAAARKPWPRAGLARHLEGCWPPLLSFCVPGES
jgi:hypothetical protein